MKKVILLIAVLTSTVSMAFSQIVTPVIWSYAAKKTGKNEATVYLKAKIDKSWHIYSLDVKDGGPVKTTFTFAPSTAYALVGKTLEPKPTEKYEPAFKMNVSYFEDQVVFQQKVKLNKSATTVKGKLEFMVCNDKQCLPPDEVAFAIPIK